MIPQTYDRTPVNGTTLRDLNLEIVQRTMQRGQELGRLHGSFDPTHYLLRYGGVTQHADALVPTIAGLISFSDVPDTWLACGIDFAVHPSDTVSPARAQIAQLRGSIFTVIDETVKRLQEVCTHGSFEGARVVTELDVPLVVLRELTTNAAVHRDMELSGSRVRIQVYPHMIEWSSPGGLPAGIRVESLVTAQFSRNPAVSQFLFHAGYIEQFGMGLDSVIAALAPTHTIPRFFDDRHSFRVQVDRNAMSTTPARSRLTSKSERHAAILELFREQPTWQQQQLLRRLPIVRATLQRDLQELLAKGMLVAEGETSARIYRQATRQQE